MIAPVGASAEITKAIAAPYRSGVRSPWQTGAGPALPWVILMTSLGAGPQAGAAGPADSGAGPAIGFGRVRRKEDDRFIRGQGRFIDDIILPGMLHGAVLRSPLAHARILSIDVSAALAHPQVHAVLTGADLEARGCAWMRTLSDDRQAVLATDKVRFHGQEVAFVIAADRSSARDALELIEVEYEPLAPVVDPRAGARARRAADPR